jgi:hypothetical protein
VIALTKFFAEVAPFALAYRLELFPIWVRLVLGFIALVACITFPIQALLIWRKFRERDSVKD